MSTRPAVAARILEALGPALRRKGGVVLEHLVDSYAEPLEQVDLMVTETPEGWPQAFDLDRTPEPRWLATSIGARLPAGMSIEEQRSFVKDRAYWRRGTPRAIAAAAATALTGDTRRVDIVERKGTPWRFGLRVWASEAPADLTEVVAATQSQKPVGLIIDPVVEVVPYDATYEHLSEEHGTYADLAAQFPVLDDPTSHVPEEGTIF